VYVPDDVIPPDHRAESATAGFHFGVARMEGENLVPTAHYGEIENSAALPHAAVLLTWLAVGDHEGHNQYLQTLEATDAVGQARRLKRFRLIDMGQMFGDFNWRADTVSSAPPSYKLPSHLAVRLTLAQLAPAFAQLRGLKPEDIRACFDDCPTAWAVPEPDREAAITRLIDSREKVEQTLKTGNPSIK
jgi:hypothetical protein